MAEIPNTENQSGLDKRPHWYAITRIDNERSLFQIPIIEPGGEWIEDLRSFVEEAQRHFYGALRDGSAKLVHLDHRLLRDHLTEDLTRIIRLSSGEKPLDACLAIMDFTRTSLPQISGKAARDAFAMGYYLGMSEHCAKHGPHRGYPYLGFGEYELVYSGDTWSKPSDLADSYYAELRKEHPLVLFWRTKGAYCIIHPDYAGPTR